MFSPQWTLQFCYESGPPAGRPWGAPASQLVRCCNSQIFGGTAGGTPCSRAGALGRRASPQRPLPPSAPPARGRARPVAWATPPRPRPRRPLTLTRWRRPPPQSSLVERCQRWRRGPSLAGWLERWPSLPEAGHRGGGGGSGSSLRATPGPWGGLLGLGIRTRMRALSSNNPK